MDSRGTGRCYGKVSTFFPLNSRTPLSGLSLDTSKHHHRFLLNITMKYSEIIEATTAEKAQKAAQKRVRAHQKLTDAQRKKSEAARRYQDQLRKANDAQTAAQAALRSI